MHPKTKTRQLFKQMASKINTPRISYFVLAVFFIFLSIAGFANHPEGAADSSATTAAVEPKVDIAAVAFEHILDSHSWHLFGEGHDAVAIPLPVILKTDNGLVTFMSSEFHHDVHGMHVVEKNGMRFVNYEESIYLASDAPNEHGAFVEVFKNEKGKEEVKNKAVLDFSITKNAAQLILSAIVLFLLFTSIARAYKSQGITSAPKGKQSFS